MCFCCDVFPQSPLSVPPDAAAALDLEATGAAVAAGVKSLQLEAMALKQLFMEHHGLISDVRELLRSLSKVLKKT